LDAPAGEIEVANGRVYSKKNPEKFIAFKDIAQGTKRPTGRRWGSPCWDGRLHAQGLKPAGPPDGAGQNRPRLEPLAPRWSRWRPI
jgi:hypothetical protein